MPSRSSAAPAKWTGTIIFVRGVIAAAIVSGVASRVSRSTSQKTGVAPARTTILTIDTQVIDGITTSSPGPSLKTRVRRCIPAVPEESATPKRLPLSSQISCSSS